MIALGFPLALLGLLAVPVVLWLHRRRRRAIPVVVPSLLFVEGEPARPAAPERFRLDAEALLAVAAAVALAFAASAPKAVRGAPGRTVRVVVDDGPAMAARSADGSTAASRAQEVVDGIRQGLASSDALEVVRAAPSRISESIRRGTASLRVVVSDRVVANLPAGARLVAVGDPAAENAGVVAVDVEDRDGERRVLATVANDSPSPRRLRLLLGGVEATVEAPARGAASALRSLGPSPGSPPDRVAVVLAEGGGALAADDRALLDARPLLAAFSPPAAGLPVAHAAAVRRTLDAVAPGRWREVAADAPEVTLFVAGPGGPAPSRSEVVLRLHPASAGRAVPRPPGTALRPPDPDIGADLDPSGLDLRYDPAVLGTPPYPLADVLRRDPTTGRVLEVAWWPDLLAGSPSPSEHPIWPLFLENVLAAVRGRSGASGWRASGTLDPSVTFLGHEVAAWSPAWLEAAPKDRRPGETPLAPWLAGGGLVLLALLWLAPRRAVPA